MRLPWALHSHCIGHILSLPLLLVSCFASMAYCQSRQTTSGGNPSGRIRITPECGQHMITIYLEFNPDLLPQGRFTDWILVGDSQRRECRLRGNGELRYVVQIAVFNDPCQTRMVAGGVFENSLRIAQFPGIILQDDYNFLFKCNNGVPQVVEFRPQPVGSIFDLDRSLVAGGTELSSNLLTTSPVLTTDPLTTSLGIQSVFPSPISPASTAIVQNTAANAPFQPISIGSTPWPSTSSSSSSSSNSAAGQQSTAAHSHRNLLAVLLSSLIVLALLVFLLFLYLCLRQCQRTAERGAKSSGTLSTNGHYLAESGPAGARSGYPQYSYPNQHRLTGYGPPTTGAPVEAASRHDAGIAGREGATSWWVGKVPSRLDEGETKGVHRFLIANGATPNGHTNGAGPQVEELVQKKAPPSTIAAEKGQLPPSKVAATAAAIDATRKFRSAELDSGGANGTPQAGWKYGMNGGETGHHWTKEREQRQKEVQTQVPTAFREAMLKASGKEAEMMAARRTPQSYAEWREKTLQKSSADHHQHQEAEDEPTSGQHPEESSLPPGCLTPVRSITEIYHSAETRLQTTTRLSRMEEEKHEEVQGRRMSFGENGRAHNISSSHRRRLSSDVEMEEEEAGGASSSPDEGEYSIPIQRLPITASARDRLVHCADKLRGFGPRRLTEQEIARWRQLIKTDADLQRRILDSRSLDELKTLCELPSYRLYFTRMKWSQIMEQVAAMILSPPPTQQPLHRSAQKQLSMGSSVGSGGGDGGSGGGVGSNVLSLNLGLFSKASPSLQQHHPAASKGHSAAEKRSYSTGYTPNNKKGGSSATPMRPDGSGGKQTQKQEEDKPRPGRIWKKQDEDDDDSLLTPERLSFSYFGTSSPQPPRGAYEKVGQHQQRGGIGDDRVAKKVIKKEMSKSYW